MFRTVGRPDNKIGFFCNEISIPHHRHSCCCTVTKDTRESRRGWTSHESERHLPEGTIKRFKRNGIVKIWDEFRNICWIFGLAKLRSGLNSLHLAFLKSQIGSESSDIKCFLAHLAKQNVSQCLVLFHRTLPSCDSNFGTLVSGPVSCHQTMDRASVSCV